MRQEPFFGELRMNFLHPRYRKVAAQRQDVKPRERLARLSLMLFALALAPNGFGADSSQTFEYPKIKGYGGVFRVSGEASMPLPDSKVVVDVTSGDQDGGVNKGLARARSIRESLHLGRRKRL